MKYLEDKANLIFPLISGGGICPKIIEAMALGKTIISTSIGAKGIYFSPGKEILLVVLLRNLWIRSGNVSTRKLCRALGHAARKCAFSHYHYLHCVQPMIAFYQKLL
ncbi:MAG: glycosyltransferase [Bacteroidales bacterium]|nr:glycosyltransferase [Bacteroidales bacterium]